MSQYKVIYGFIDQVEGKGYRTGDKFVVGPQTDKERIKSLSTNENQQGRPLIQQVKTKIKKGTKRE